MAEILCKCPYCGSKLEYLECLKYTDKYDISEEGRMIKKGEEKGDLTVTDMRFVCLNEDCSFRTDYRMEPEDSLRLYIYRVGDKFMYVDRGKPIIISTELQRLYENLCIEHIDLPNCIPEKCGYYGRKCERLDGKNKRKLCQKCTLSIFATAIAAILEKSDELDILWAK